MEKRMAVLLSAMMCLSSISYSKADNIDSEIELYNSSGHTEEMDVKTSNGEERDYFKADNGIEMMVNESGSSVENELQKLILMYKNELELVQEPEEIEKLEDLINVTQELLEQYVNSSNEISPYGIYHPTLSTAVTSVIAWFSSNGYYLASELLSHAVSNDEKYSLYIPRYRDRVFSSSVYKKIKASTSLSGSDAFPNSGNTVDKDLYYAIHAFDYTKDSPHGRVSITDTYNFDYGDYSGIAQAAINTMWEAQELGVLVPFKILIKD